MPEWLEKLVTLYGPMGGGWLIAYFLWARLQLVEDQRNTLTLDLLHKGTELAENNVKTLNSVLVILERVEERLELARGSHRTAPRRGE